MKQNSRIRLLALFVLLFYFAGYSVVIAGQIKVPDYGNTPDDRFGNGVSISGSNAIVGSYKDGGSGAAYILRYNGTNWVQESKLIPLDAVYHGYFGYSVSISGNYAIVGAYNNDGNEMGAGAAYIFRYSNGHWTQHAKLQALDGERNDYFGYSVSISGDLAIVGAYRDDNTGSAYVYKHTGGVWVQVSKLIASDRTGGDNFGRSVSISGDYAIAGAMHRGENGLSSGAAYIFKYNGSTWTQTSKLTGSDTDKKDFFGYSVALSGSYAIIGAVNDDAKGDNSGAAYVFKNSGGSWKQDSKLVPSDGNSMDFFGCSVAISGDYAIAGAYADDNRGDNSGAVYIFKNDGSCWTQQEKKYPGDGGRNDYFGRSVSIFSSQAASYCYIGGAPGDDEHGQNSGSVYFYGDFPVGSPEMDVYPKTLTLDRSKSARMAPRKISRSGSDEEYKTGLVIPEYVKEYWKDNPPSPSKMTPPAKPVLPDVVDWSEFDGPVKSQGRCAACSVFAAIGLVENLGNQAGLPVFQDLSAQAVLSCFSEINCSTGGWYSEVLKFISERGIPAESCQPYTGNSSGTCTEGRCVQPDFLEKIANFTGMQGLWGEIMTHEDLKFELQNGPFCVSMRVPDDGTFTGNGYKGGVYNYEGGEIDWDTNGHAVLVVGYDDNQQCFKVKNSWGEDWGENGYFRISYDDVTDDVKFGSYAVTASGPYLAGRMSTFTIANRGAADLQITNLRSDKSWLSFSPSAPFSIKANSQKAVVVSVKDWCLLNGQADSGTITINSNDPQNSKADVDVTAKPLMMPCPGKPPIEFQGDIDKNYEVDLVDAVLALQVLTGITTNNSSIRKDYIISNIDVNENDRIGLEEVVYILKSVADDDDDDDDD